MLLSPAHRRTIHAKLSPIVGEEEVDAMLAQFPASESDAPVTTAYFEQRIAALEGNLRAEMHNLGRQMVMWSTSAVIGGMGLAAAIGAAFGG